MFHTIVIPWSHGQYEFILILLNVFNKHEKGKDDLVDIFLIRMNDRAGLDLLYGLFVCVNKYKRKKHNIVYVT